MELTVLGWLWLLAAAAPEPPVDLVPPQAVLFDAGTPAGGEGAPGAQDDPGDAHSDALGEPSNITSGYLDNIVQRLAREGNQEGLAHFKRSDYPAALTAFLESHALAPNDPELTNNLGYTYHKLGNRAAAERYYLRTLELDPKRRVAYLNLADLWLEDADTSTLERAQQLLVRAREITGNTLSIIRRQARIAAKLANFEQARDLYEMAEDAASGEPRSVRDALYLEVGDFMRDFGRPQEARAWYGMVSAGAREQAASRVRQLEIDTEARRFGWTRRPLEISPRARGHLERAHAYRRQGKVDLAREHLVEALRLSPSFTSARVALGDLHRQQTDLLAAETEYLRALAFDQSDVTVHVRLAELYLSSDERAAEATLLLERAVHIEPTEADPFFLLAKAYRHSGDLPRALGAVGRYLALVPEAPPEAEDGRSTPPQQARREAEQLRASLEALLDEKAPIPAVDTDPQGELRKLYNRVRVLLGRGETDAAMAELGRATEEPQSISLRNLKARLLAAVGRRHEAEAVFRSSLELNPEQPSVRAELGLLLSEAGDAQGALAELDAAAAAGDPRARLHRGRIRLQLHHARSWWDRTLALSSLWQSYEELHEGTAPHDRLEPQLASLRRRYQDELLLGAAAWVSPPMALLLIAIWPWWRRRRGETLAGLLARVPDTGPEVQRILSSIRHEVLKHHTMMLTGLVEGLEREEDAATKALAAAQALGNDGGVLRRLRDYVAQLQRVGRARGIELNLRHKDPALSVLLRGFGALERISRALARWDRLGRSARRRTLKRLRRVAQQLNVDAYGEVLGLMERLRSLSLDRQLLEQLYRDTLDEPALRDLPSEPLTLDAQVEFPLHLALPRSHFEDILRNVLRNAVQAQARDGLAPIRVGLVVAREVHPITGHARIRIEVRDTSHRELTTQQLRQHNIEGGLGLTTELVSRYQGSMMVKPCEPPWQKAVVIKLPAPESNPKEASHARVDH